MFTVKFYNDGVCERIMEADVVTATTHPLTVHLSKGTELPFFSAQVQVSLPSSAPSGSFAKVIVENSAGRTTEIYTPSNRLEPARFGQIGQTDGANLKITATATEIRGLSAGDAGRVTTVSATGTNSLEQKQFGQIGSRDTSAAASA